MSKFKISFASDATPIDPNELRDLIPDYISTMDELNEVEQSNIADGFLWAQKQDFEELLTATFVFKLHEKMFNQVWKWAGKARRTNKNIGGNASERIAVGQDEIQKKILHFHEFRKEFITTLKVAGLTSERLLAVESQLDTPLDPSEKQKLKFQA